MESESEELDSTPVIGQFTKCISFEAEELSDDECLLDNTQGYFKVLNKMFGLTCKIFFYI